MKVCQKRFLLLIFILFYFKANSQINLNSGLVGFWKLDNNGLDSTLNGLNGTVNNTTSALNRTLAGNSALSFNGSSSSVSIPYNTLFNIAPSGSFSISCWVRPTNTTGVKAIFVKSLFNPVVQSSLWDFGLYQVNDQFMTGYSNTNFLLSNTRIQANVWYLVTVTYSNGIWNMYINCNLDNSNTSGTYRILQSAGGVAIGKKGEANGDWFLGLIDDVRFYDRVLTLAEHRYIFNNYLLTCCTSYSLSNIPNRFERCGEGVVTAVLNPSGAYNWYSGLANGTLLASNTNAYQTSISQNQTVYITSVTSSNCESNLYPVDLIVNQLPEQPIPNVITHCGPLTLTLNATGGPNYNWYSGLTAITTVGTGSTLSLGTVTQSTTYYLSTNNQSCQSSRVSYDIFIYSVPDKPIIDIQGGYNFCKGEVLTLTSSNATNNVWSNGSTQGFIQVTSSGRYYVFQKSIIGCLSDTSNIESVQGFDSIPKHFMGTDLSTCRTDTILTLSVQNGDSYTWFTPSGSFTGSAAYLLDRPGTYKVRVLRTGCEGIDSITYSVIPLQVELGNDIKTCKKQVTLLNTLIGTKLNYSWILPSKQVLYQSSIITSEKGVHKLVISKNGCASAFDSVNVDSIPTYVTHLYYLPQSEQNIDSLIYTPIPSKFQLFTTISGLNYSWKIGNETIENNTDSTQNIELKSPGDYWVQMRTVNTDSCKFLSSKLLRIRDLIIPNVITPNGDGINDAFYINCTTCFHQRLQLVNRWGTIIYEKSSNSKFEEFSSITDGLYYYSLTVEAPNVSKDYRGWLQIIR